MKMKQAVPIKPVEEVIYEGKERDEKPGPDDVVIFHDPRECMEEVVRNVLTLQDGRVVSKRGN